MTPTLSTINPDSKISALTLPLISLVTMFGLSLLAPAYYSTISQEDQIVEWLTASLFLAAGGLILRYAIRTRHLFDGLVGVFCLMSAAEEVSWVQRLIGIDPPKYFLAANVQQEVSLQLTKIARLKD